MKRRGFLLAIAGAVLGRQKLLASGLGAFPAEPAPPKYIHLWSDAKYQRLPSHTIVFHGTADWGSIDLFVVEMKLEGCWAIRHVFAKQDFPDWPRVDLSTALPVLPDVERMEFSFHRDAFALVSDPA